MAWEAPGAWLQALYDVYALPVCCHMTLFWRFWTTMTLIPGGERLTLDVFSSIDEGMMIGAVVARIYGLVLMIYENR
jgi:hypothetical protein